MFVIMPNYAWWDRQNYKTGRTLPEGFHYTSNNNDEWLTVEDLAELSMNPPPRKAIQR